MGDHVELDVILRWGEAAEGFDVTLIYDHPGATQDTQKFVDNPLKFDTDALMNLRDDANAYGEALTDMMFRDGQTRAFFARALQSADDKPVHLRLLIDPRSPAKYQAIRWETLRNPDGPDRLTISDKVRFSRYLNGSDWTQVAPLPREGDLCALVVVANPTDIADWYPGGLRLGQVDVNKELELARDAMVGMTIRKLPDGAGKGATVETIVEALREGADVLYLVCHGSISNSTVKLDLGQSQTDEVDGINHETAKLYLEDDQGQTDEVDGAAFAKRIAGLNKLPAVVVLCSCQSAGPGDEYLPSDLGPMSPLGPLLAHAGVSTVVAMQGNVTMTTTRRFMRRFFSELRGDGQADRAMAIARGSVSDRPDWWMPVLFSRLKRGRPWYEPRFGGKEAYRFADLRTRITENNCLPILGSGVAGEGFMPSREVLARSWVDRRQMPIIKSSRGDLAMVAQYLAVESGKDMPRTELSRYLRTYLKGTHANVLPDLDWDGAPLQELVSKVGRRQREELGSDDLNAILARQCLPIYVTTSWTTLLEDALTDAGRSPQVRYFDWYRQLNDAEEPVDPTTDHPLVYHLFGAIDRHNSTVLTEDDYFAWLRAWIKRVDKGDDIPDCIKAAMTQQSLLFLGYGLADWEFRVVFQSIKSFEANSDLRSRGHVGVQFSPEAVNINQDSAQEYLQQYFKDDNVDIYWGSCTDFLKDLRDVDVPR